MLNNVENKALEGIKATPYMQKTIALVEDFVENYAGKDRKVAYLAVFDEIFHILNKAKSYVDKYLQERKEVCLNSLTNHLLPRM